MYDRMITGHLNLSKLLPFKEWSVSFHTEEEPQGSEGITLENKRICDSQMVAQQIKTFSGLTYHEVNMKVALLWVWLAYVGAKAYNWKQKHQ